MPQHATAHSVWHGAWRGARLGAGCSAWHGAWHSATHTGQAVAAAAGLQSGAADSQFPVHTLRGVNSDSGEDIGRVLPATDGLPEGCVPCEGVLYAVLAECRVVKSTAELQLMAYVSWLSSMAHVEVRPPHARGVDGGVTGG